MITSAIPFLPPCLPALRSQHDEYNRKKRAYRKEQAMLMATANLLKKGASFKGPINTNIVSTKSFSYEDALNYNDGTTDRANKSNIKFSMLKVFNSTKGNNSTDMSQSAEERVPESDELDESVPFQFSFKPANRHESFKGGLVVPVDVNMSPNGKPNLSKPNRWGFLKANLQDSVQIETGVANGDLENKAFGNQSEIAQHQSSGEILAEGGEHKMLRSGSAQETENGGQIVRKDYVLPSTAGPFVLAPLAEETEEDNGNRDNGNRDNGNRDNGNRDNGNREDGGHFKSAAGSEIETVPCSKNPNAPAPAPALALAPTPAPTPAPALALAPLETVSQDESEKIAEIRKRLLDPVFIGRLQNGIFGGVSMETTLPMGNEIGLYNSNRFAVNRPQTAPWRSKNVRARPNSSPACNQTMSGGASAGGVHTTPVHTTVAPATDSEPGATAVRWATSKAPGSPLISPKATIRRNENPHQTQSQSANINMAGHFVRHPGGKTPSSSSTAGDGLISWDVGGPNDDAARYSARYSDVDRGCAGRDNYRALQRAEQRRRNRAMLDPLVSVYLDPHPDYGTSVVLEPASSSSNPNSAPVTPERAISSEVVSYGNRDDTLGAGASKPSTDRLTYAPFSQDNVADLHTPYSPYSRLLFGQPRDEGDFEQDEPFSYYPG